MNKKINVGLFSPGWPLSAYPNGIVTYVQNIISGFNEYDVLATIVTANIQVGASGASGASILDLAQFYKDRNFMVKLCDKILLSGVANDCVISACRDYKIKRDISVIIDALNSLKNEVDIIEVEEAFGKAKYLEKETSVPIVTRLHGPWFIIGQYSKLAEVKGYKYRVHAEGDAISASHGITAPSMDVLNRVREYYDFPLPLAKVIPNPVLPVPIERHWQYRPELNPTILVVGRFDLVKGGDLAIDVFRIIATKNKVVELVFVGPDREIIINNRSYMFSSYVNTFIPEESIKKRIKFCGHYSVDEIAALRQKTTITLIPSRYETFSFSLAEALAAGSPVVAYNVGAIGELVTDGYNGLLAEAESRESMAEIILNLLDDPEKMKRMSKNSINDTKARFSPKVVAQQTLDYYRSIIDKY